MGFHSILFLANLKKKFSTSLDANRLKINSTSSGNSNPIDSNQFFNLNKSKTCNSNYSDFGLRLIGKLVRINWDCTSWIESDWFLADFHWAKLKNFFCIGVITDLRLEILDSSLAEQVGIVLSSIQSQNFICVDY